MILRASSKIYSCVASVAVYVKVAKSQVYMSNNNCIIDAHI